MRGNKYIVAGALALMAAGPAFAQQNSCCVQGGNVQNATQLGTLLTGKTVCGALNGEEWQEVHNADGSLFDLKGTTTAQERVGTWSVIGQGNNAQVQYNYGSGGTYSYTVCTQGAQVHFCGARNITGARVIASNTRCN